MRQKWLHIDGVFTYGMNSFDQRRNIRYSINQVSVDQTASSDFDGHQWSATLGGGYSMNQGGFNFGPTGRLEYVHAKVGGYAESMSDPTANGGGWATRINSQEVDSFNMQLGADVSYAMSQSWGVLLPQANLEWVHEFNDGGSSVTGYFLQDPTQNTFSLNTDKPDTDYFNMRLGVSAQFKQGTSAYFYYRKLLGYDNLNVDSFSAGLRLEF